MSAEIAHAHEWDRDDLQNFVGLGVGRDEIFLYQFHRTSSTGWRQTGFDTEDVVRTFDYSPAQPFQVGYGLNSGAVHVLDLAPDKQPGPPLVFKQRATRKCNAVSFSTESLMASGYEKTRGMESLLIWDLGLASPTPLTAVPTSDSVAAAAFVPSDPAALVFGGSRSLREFDLRAGAVTTAVATAMYMRIVFNPTNDVQFATHGETNHMALWDRRMLRSRGKQAEPVLVIPRAFKETQKVDGRCLRFSLLNENEVAVLSDGAMIRRWQTSRMWSRAGAGAAASSQLTSGLAQHGGGGGDDDDDEVVSLSGASDSGVDAAGDAAVEDGEDEGGSAAGEPASAALFVNKVFEVRTDSDKVVSFDYAANGATGGLDLVCMRQSGGVFRMSVRGPPLNIYLDPFNDFRMVSEANELVETHRPDHGKLTAVDLTGEGWASPEKRPGCEAGSAQSAPAMPAATGARHAATSARHAATSAMHAPAHSGPVATSSVHAPANSLHAPGNSLHAPGNSLHGANNAAHASSTHAPTSSTPAPTSSTPAPAGSKQGPGSSARAPASIGIAPTTTIESESDENSDSDSSLASSARSADHGAGGDPAYLGNEIGLPTLLSNDIASTMQRRALAGYSLDAAKNIELLLSSKFNPTSHGNPATWSGLMAAWRWVRQQQSAPESARNYLETPELDLRYIGVYTMWNGSREALLPRLAPGVKLTGRTLNDAVKYTLRKSAGSVYVKEEDDKALYRQLCLRLTGWDFGLNELEARLEELEGQHKYEKAAGWAVFHNNVERSVESLANSPKKNLRLMSTAIAGYLVYKDVTQNNVWREQCRRLASELSVPYLRAIFAYIADGSWSDVLDDGSLPLTERLGIALRFLPQKEVGKYLSLVTSRAIANGDLEGIILTGFTPKVLDLLQAYLDRSGDLQTVCLLVSFGWPRYFSDPRFINWFSEYRQILNSWKYFTQRARLDIARSRLFKSKSATLIKPIQGQAFLRCSNCKEDISGAPRDAKRAVKGVEPAKQLRNRCLSCNNPLPPCGICTLPLGPCLDDEVESDRWPTFCLKCNHGHHSVHARQWFQKYDVCPMPSCPCMCGKTVR